MVPDVHVLLLGPTDEDPSLFSRVPADGRSSRPGEHVRVFRTREAPGLSRQRRCDRADQHQRGAAARPARSGRGQRAERGDGCGLVPGDPPRSCGRSSVARPGRLRDAALESAGDGQRPRRSSARRQSQKAIRRGHPGEDGKVLQQTRRRRTLSRTFIRSIWRCRNDRLLPSRKYDGRNWFCAQDTGRARRSERPASRLWPCSRGRRGSMAIHGTGARGFRGRHQAACWITRRCRGSPRS